MIRLLRLLFVLVVCASCAQDDAPPSETSSAAATESVAPTTTPPTSSTTSTTTTSTSTTTTTTTSTTTTTVPPADTAVLDGLIADVSCGASAIEGDELEVAVPSADVETTTYEVAINRVRSNTPASMEAAVGVTEVTLTSTPADAGWSLAWVNGSTEVRGVPEFGGATDAVDQFAGLTIQYSLGPFGEFSSIDNTAEIRAEIVGLWEDLSAGDPSMAATLDFFENMPEAQLEALFSEEIQMLHYMDGTDWYLGDDVSYDDFLPNTLGGAPFPAVTEIEIPAEPDDRGCIVISLVTVIDPEKGAAIIEETVTNAFDAEPGGFSLDEIRNSLSWTVDPATGRVLQVIAFQRIGDATGAATTTKAITALD